MVKSSIGKVKKKMDEQGNVKTVAADVNPMTKWLGGNEKSSYKPTSTTWSTQLNAPKTPISPSQKWTESQTVTQPAQQTIWLAWWATEFKEKAATSSDWARGWVTDIKAKGTEDMSDYIGSPVKSPAELEMEQIQKDKQRLEEEALAKANQLDAYNQSKVLEQSKRDQEYMAKQKELTDRQQAISEEMQQTASSQRIKQAQNSLQNLKQNVGYLGQQGRPWKSLQALEGMTNMLAEWQRVYQELKQNEQYAEEMRRLWYEFDANAYEKEMEDLQYRLDQQVTQSIQKIFDQMTADEIAGKLDTLEEVEKLGARYYNMLDEDIASITRKEYDIAMLKLNRANESLQQVKKVVENKNKWQVHPNGYYVDGNGTPLVDNMWQPIQVPAEAPYEPVISADKSQMVTFWYDEAGNVVSTVHNLFDAWQTKTWENTTIANMAKAVDDGTLTVSDALKFLPEGSQQQFFNMLWGQQAPWVQPWWPLPDLTSLRGTTISNTGNVGNDLNNPWNLVAWGTADQYAVGTVNVVGQDWVSRNFLVFPDLETWYLAVQSDLEAKMTWNSRVISPDASLWELLDVWVWWQWAWAWYKQTVQQVTWYDMWETISWLDSWLLLEWIKKAEGATWWGHDYSALWAMWWQPTEQKYIPELEQYYARYLSKEVSKNRITKSEREQLKKDWWVDSKELAVQAQARKKEKDLELKPQALELVNALKQLQDMSWEDYQQFRLWTPWRWQDLVSLYDRAVASLWLQNLVDLKNSWATFGQLSDNELRFITDMSTNLNKWGTRESFNKNVKRHIDILNKWVKWVVGEEIQEEKAQEQEVDQQILELLMSN